VEIREWHVVISGFLQKSGTLNGVTRVWGDLRQITVGRLDACVELIRWSDDYDDLAERIKQLSPVDNDPTVNVYGYSYGGMSGVNFAKCLKKRGLKVNHIVLCDAVYRHWYWAGNWRSLVSWRSISVPDNVLRVTQFRQRESLPMGHEIKAENAGLTDLGPINWLTTDHCWMDDHPAFRKACKEACQASGKGEV